MSVYIDVIVDRVFDRCGDVNTFDGLRNVFVNLLKSSINVTLFETIQFDNEYEKIYLVKDARSVIVKFLHDEDAPTEFNIYSNSMYVIIHSTTNIKQTLIKILSYLKG